MPEPTGPFYLRKKHPPFGTPASPLWEFAYDERVKVEGGLARCQSPATRDRLVRMGYEVVGPEAPPPAGKMYAPDWWGKPAEKPAGPGTPPKPPTPPAP